MYNTKYIFLLLTTLLSGSAHAQNVFFPANPGDMIVKGTVGAWIGVPGGTAGCVLMSQGPTAAPTWSCALPLSFQLPPMAPNTVWGNMTAAQAVPTAANISQFLNTIDFDIQRPPLPGATIYKGTDNLWHTAPPATAGWVWTSRGAGAIPQWQLPTASVAEITVGSTVIIGGTSGGILFNNAGVLGNTTYGIREKLTADRTYTVNCAGGADFTTLQGAGDAIWKTLDTQLHDVTVNIADGSCYTTGLILSGPNVGGGTISFIGNPGTPSAVDINAAGSRVLNLSNGATLTVSGVKMRASLEDVLVTSGAQLTLSAFEVGAAGQHFEVDTNGRLYVTGNYTISGAANVHLHVNKNGFASFSGGTANISTLNLHFANFFFGASQNSSTFYNTFTYGGAGFATVTGQAYFIHSQTMVDLGAGVNATTFFPGDGAASSTLNAGGNLNGNFGNTSFGLGDTPTTISVMGNTSGTAGGAKIGTGDGVVLLGQLGTWSAIFGGAYDAGTTLASSNSMTLLSADGKTSGGRGAANYTIAANGPTSGTGGGARVQAENGGVTRAAIGNWSSFIGGAYDATGTFFTAGPMRLLAGDSSTLGCALGLKSDGSGQLSCVTSSARFKDGIIALRDVARRSPEAILDALRPVQFTRNDEDGKPLRLGLIAEEVEKIDPALVFYDTQGRALGVDYYGVLADVIAVAQAQQRHIGYVQTALCVVALFGIGGFILFGAAIRRRDQNTKAG